MFGTIWAFCSTITCPNDEPITQTLIEGKQLFCSLCHNKCVCVFVYRDGDYYIYQNVKNLYRQKKKKQQRSCSGTL